MPLHDGTGPWGMGAGTGRKKGTCFAGFDHRRMSQSVFRGRQSWLVGIAVPLVTTVLRDLLNPSGVIRRIVYESVHKRISDDSQNSVRQAEYSIVSKHSAKSGR